MEILISNHKVTWLRPMLARGLGQKLLAMSFLLYLLQYDSKNIIFCMYRGFKKGRKYCCKERTQVLIIFAGSASSSYIF